MAQDGSGNYKTINSAVAALAKMGHNRPERAIIYVKSGVYEEKVEIERKMKNVLLIGDGMDKTIVTGNQNVQDGASTSSSATFGKPQTHRDQILTFLLTIKCNIQMSWYIIFQEYLEMDFGRVT